jgi:hypothetical protein
MAFSTDLAELVATQLTRFVTLNPHQLAGQVANLDFWLAQVRNALDTIDGYGVRFIQMDAAQEQYVTIYNTTVSVVTPTDPEERRPAPPRRIPDRELQMARRALVAATRQFLERCHVEALISNVQFAEALQNLGIAT